MAGRRQIGGKFLVRRFLTEFPASPRRDSLVLHSPFCPLNSPSPSFPPQLLSPRVVSSTMAKSRGRARRSSDDAESTTSSVSTASRTASGPTPPSPRLNGSPPKRKPSASHHKRSPPTVPETVTLRSAADERQKRIVNFRERTLWTFILLAGYFTLLAMGHMYIIVLVTIVQIIVYKEVIAIASVPAQEKKIPFFKVLNWYD